MTQKTATQRDIKTPRKSPSKDRRTGLKPKHRSLAVKQPNKKLTGNQWQATAQQHDFMDRWLNPQSPTFSNAYQSAIASNYSEHYAAQITSVGSEWIAEYTRKANMQGEHVLQGLIDMYRNPQSFNNAKSPADTRLKALELLAKVTGLLNDKPTTTITVVQPILGGQSIKEVDRVIIDQ